MTPAELAESNDSNSLLTTDTYQTDETESSATTVWGPGTLSGKAIKSLGEASLRGLDHLIIRWKLARINSDLAKSNASTGTSSFSDEKLERIWDDLLELSRLDFYDAKVRQKALRLIMIQIGSRETSHLVSCIMKWPPEEIRIFLSEMMEFMPILWKRENRETSQVLSYPELILVYRASQSTTERHEIIPFLDFVSQVAQKRSFIRQAVLAAGYLTLLTDIHRHYNVESALEAIIAAREALVVFLDNPEPLEHHRMDLVWPRATSNIPMTRKSLELATLTPNKRKLAWMSAERARIRERLCEIQVILEMPIYHHEGCQADLFDLCFDLVVLHHLEEIDRTLAEVAFSHLVRCVAVGGALGEALRYVLAHNKWGPNRFRLLNTYVDKSLSIILIETQSTTLSSLPLTSPMQATVVLRPSWTPTSSPYWETPPRISIGATCYNGFKMQRPLPKTVFLRA
ncbi:hypothetical protein V5O48_008529 [Marasmius crinis-equi]|uniref:Uncharacterized protein n=1 Tax=Marasmius crinis-equi TaxID=585013 RepID=A0ABR3FDP2_9AGAR